MFTFNVKPGSKRNTVTMFGISWPRCKRTTSIKSICHGKGLMWKPGKGHHEVQALPPVTALFTMAMCESNSPCLYKQLWLKLFEHNYNTITTNSNNSLVIVNLSILKNKNFLFFILKRTLNVKKSIQCIQVEYRSIKSFPKVSEAT